MSVVIITGLSGSGKTTALHALEDLGYFCMDNLPVVLLPKVVELADSREAGMRIGVVVDARDRRFIQGAGDVVDALRSSEVDTQVIYLESNPQSIIKRFSETRRKHPLSETGDFPAAITEEQYLLLQLRERADLVLDTTHMTVHELKKVVQDRFGSVDQTKMRVRIVSFGFKHGPPSQADLVFDVRFLPNPHFHENLKPMSGLDAPVQDFVKSQVDYDPFMVRVWDLLSFLVPRFIAEGKAYLTIAIGCTGGKHRSVTIAEDLGERFRGLGIEPSIEHRDRERWK